jgi:DNA-binding LacI/PurR family transcriptional regulator
MASTIGIVTIGQAPDFFSGRYFREILTAASESAVQQGCQMKIIPLSHEQAANPATARAMLTAEGIDALVVVAPTEGMLDALGAIFRSRPGIIISPPHLDTTLSYVASDNYGATRQLVEHLAGHGYQRILLLRPDILSGDYHERTRGYEAAAAALGLVPLVDGLFHPATVEQVSRWLAVYTPEAIIAPSDPEAQAMLACIRRLGRRVPQDVALVGFDDEDFAAEMDPPLTTVAQPIAEMARRATQYLADHLAGVERHVYHAVLSNRLVVRASCGAHSSE